MESVPSWVHVLAGGSAGATAALVSCPLDVVKMRTQSGILSTSRPFAVMAQTWKSEGLAGFYRGLGTAMIGYLVTHAIYFGVYQRAKPIFASMFQGNPQTNALVHAWAAITAGIATNISTNPIWLVRARIITHDISPSSRAKLGAPLRHKAPKALYHGLDAAAEVVAQHGVRGLWRGTLVSLVGVVHPAIQLPLYEIFRRRFSKHHDMIPGSYAIVGAALASKIAAATVTYPHEVIRTQIQTRADVRNVRDAIRSIWARDGTRGFYRGLTINVIRALPSSAVVFLAYEKYVLGLLYLDKRVGARRSA